MKFLKHIQSLFFYFICVFFVYYGTILLACSNSQNSKINSENLKKDRKKQNQIEKLCQTKYEDIQNSIEWYREDLSAYNEKIMQYQEELRNYNNSKIAFPNLIETYKINRQEYRKLVGSIHRENFEIEKCEEKFQLKMTEIFKKITLTIKTQFIPGGRFCTDRVGYNVSCDSAAVYSGGIIPAQIKIDRIIENKTKYTIQCIEGNPTIHGPSNRYVKNFQPGSKEMFYHHSGVWYAGAPSAGVRSHKCFSNESVPEDYVKELAVVNVDRTCFFGHGSHVYCTVYGISSDCSPPKSIPTPPQRPVEPVQPISPTFSPPETPPILLMHSLPSMEKFLGDCIDEEWKKQ